MCLLTTGRWEVLERSNWAKVTREQTVRLLGNFAEQVLCSPDVGEADQTERLRLLVQGFASRRLPEVDWVSLKYTQLPPLPTVETDMGLFKGCVAVRSYGLSCKWDPIELGSLLTCGAAPVLYSTFPVR